MSGRGGGGLHSWVQCTMGNGHMGTPMNRMTTRLKTLRSRNFFGGR